MGRMSRYKKIKSCDPFYKGPKKDKNSTCVSILGRYVQPYSHCDITAQLESSSYNKPLLKNDKLIEQEMPRAAKDLFRRQLAMKNQATVKKKDKKRKKEATAKFQWIPGESKKQYFDRIDQETANEVALSLKASRKMREGRKKHLTERKQKIKEKKKSLEENANFTFTKDNVRFGEVAMEPPSLTAKPRKAPKTSKGSKPLLLNSLISQERETNSDANTQTKTSGDTTALPKTKKRKHMSVVEREKADKERERAIMAYRLMRKQQLREKKGAM